MYNKFNFSDLANPGGVIYIVRDPRNIKASLLIIILRPLKKHELINKIAYETGEPEGEVLGHLILILEIYQNQINII